MVDVTLSTLVFFSSGKQKLNQNPPADFPFCFMNQNWFTRATLLAARESGKENTQLPNGGRLTMAGDSLSCVNPLVLYFHLAVLPSSGRMAQ